MNLTLMQIKTSLMDAIYRKSLVVTSTSGELVNLMAVDCQQVGQFVLYMHEMWSAPLQVAVTVFILYQILGPSALAGFALLIILIPVQSVGVYFYKGIYQKTFKLRDKRTKKMNEILQGMKILKLYAWEPSFIDEVEDIRSQEIDVLYKFAYMYTSFAWVWQSCSFLMALVSFATYVLSSSENVLGASTAFPALSLFNILAPALTPFPFYINTSIQAWVSMQRINKFTRNEELDPTIVERSFRGEKNVVEVEGGNFRWNKDAPAENETGVKIKEQQGRIEPGNGQSVTTERKDAQS